MFRRVLQKIALQKRTFDDGLQRRWVNKIILHKEIIQSDRQEQQLQWEREKRALEVTGKDPITLEPLVDMPDQLMANPFEKPAKKCLLCDLKVDLDYKNVKLLSQFVSPHTGQIYGRAVTGLCLYMQRRVALNIKRARNFGYMSYMVKNPKYLKDPKLFDPYRRRK